MEFKVGDRVRMFKDHYAKKGELGTVVAVDGEDSVGVEFDLFQKSGHDCDGAGKNGHCWWIEPDYLEKASSGQQAKPTPVLFVAIYDENDGDPTKTFTSGKDLYAWLEEAINDRGINFGSIKVFEVKQELKVDTQFSLKKVA